jgi:hypothetical protein
MTDFDEPVDFDEVDHDEESLTSLLEGGYVDGEALFLILARWRAEMDVVGIPELVGTREAMAVIRSARRWRRWDIFTKYFFWSLFLLPIVLSLTMSIGV